MTQTMYAKNQPSAPTLEFPYQKQQRDSGRFFVEIKDSDQQLSEQDVQILSEALRANNKEK